MCGFRLCAQKSLQVSTDRMFLLLLGPKRRHTEVDALETPLRSCQETSARNSRTILCTFCGKTDMSPWNLEACQQPRPCPTRSKKSLQRKVTKPRVGPVVCATGTRGSSSTALFKVFSRFWALGLRLRLSGLHIQAAALISPRLLLYFLSPPRSLPGPGRQCSFFGVG